MSDKDIVLVGATGAIGKEVYKQLIKDSYNVTVVARDMDKAGKLFPESKGAIKYDIADPESLSNAMEEAHGVINLSGAPIFEKWKGDYEQEVVDSRVKGTAYIVKAISMCEKKPLTLINGSASGFYGYSKSVNVNEDSPPGTDFWGKLVSDWEEEALKAREYGLRVVLVRTTLVLKDGEGALGVLVPYFRRGMGGYVRPGNQQFPWISMEDEVGVIMQCLKNDSFSGPINCVAGNITSKKFSEVIGSVIGHRGSLPIPKFIIKSMFGKASDLVTHSQIVTSTRMEELEYMIHENTMEESLNKLFKENHSEP